MATKAGLKSALQGFISAVVGVIKHRNANDAMVDEFYSDVYLEQSPDALGDNVITAPINGQKKYQLHMAKQGRFVKGNGILVNTTGTTVNNETWFTVSGDYLPFLTTQYFFGKTTSGAIVECRVDGSGNFIIYDALPSGQTVRINFEYLTKE